MRASASAATKITVSSIIVRACTICNGPRQIGAPCAQCGNPERPVTHDLGIQAAWYRSFWKRLGWNLIGKRKAVYRAKH